MNEGDGYFSRGPFGKSCRHSATEFSDTTGFDLSVESGVIARCQLALNTVERIAYVAKDIDRWVAHGGSGSCLTHLRVHGRNDLVSLFEDGIPESPGVNNPGKLHQGARGRLTRRFHSKCLES
jgi:hypothetical protein